MPSKIIPEPWRSFLSDIDESLTEEVELHCLGGFVITVLYGLPRPTADVDVIAITPRTEIESLLNHAGQGSKLHRKHKVYLQLVGVATVPDGYERRLTEISPDPFKRLRILALDPYDLALSKIERNTQRDRDDVRHLARTVPFDLDILRQRYQAELRPYLGNAAREDLTLTLVTDCNTNQDCFAGTKVEGYCLVVQEPEPATDTTDDTSGDVTPAVDSKLCKMLGRIWASTKQRWKSVWAVRSRPRYQAAIKVSSCGEPILNLSHAIDPN
jgi:hypothetical protein